MAFSLLRQVPERRDGGATEALLAALATAAADVATGVGPRPAPLRDVVDALATGLALAPRPIGGRDAGAPVHLALEVVRGAIYSVPERAREARLLWREAVATAWCAGAIARLAGGSPGTAGLAGLLHRAGDALALRAVAVVESAEGARLDPSSVQTACSTFEPELTAALGRQWRLAPGVLAALQGWRRVGESAAPGADARAVYFGHAFASQVLFAEFPAPGLADEIGTQLGLERRELARLRATLAPLAAAVDSLLVEGAAPRPRPPARA